MRVHYPPCASVMPTTGRRGGLAHSLHARSVRAVRRLRRPPARAGAARRRSRAWSTCSNRSASSPRGTHRDLAAGRPALAGAGAAAGRSRLPRHRSRDPVAGRGGGADLPPRRPDLGRALAAGPGRPAGRPRGPQPAPGGPHLRRLRRAGAAGVGEPVRARGARRGAAACGCDGPAGARGRDRARAGRRVGPRRAGRGVPLLRGQRRHVAPDARAPTATRTGRPSPRGSTSCTSGASSSSPIPGCPRSCCRADWAGRRAAELFTSEAERLKPAADRYVARCLD